MTKTLTHTVTKSVSLKANNFALVNFQFTLKQQVFYIIPPDILFPLIRWVTKTLHPYAAAPSPLTDLPPPSHCSPPVKQLARRWWSCCHSTLQQTVAQVNQAAELCEGIEP